MSKNIRQQSVDMGLILGKNMGGWVGFFIFGPHTPVTFLDKYLPQGEILYILEEEEEKKLFFPVRITRGGQPDI